MSQLGHPLHFRDVRFVSAFHPIATKSRTSRFSVSATSGSRSGHPQWSIFAFYVHLSRFQRPSN